MWELCVCSGTSAGKRLILPIGKRVIVGRDAGCQITLNSAAVSRQHAELLHAADGIWVRDLDSQNGTYVNDVAVTGDLLLSAGDVLRIGASVFEALHQGHAERDDVWPTPSEVRC